MLSQVALQNIGQNLSALGFKKQMAFAAAVLAVIAGTVLIVYAMQQPSHRMIYTGLAKSDIGLMTAALSEAGIDHAVTDKGDGLLVSPGKVTRARMLLAERGLPAGSSAGYELFDKLGSLSLTSFMQEITRKRALEGEIARTVQSMRGVLAARVHIVMEDAGSFRRQKRPPSASVVIRAVDMGDTKLAGAIRHLVAAAVPGLSMGNVTVLSFDGTVLASGGSSVERTLHTQVGLENTISEKLKRKVSDTLTPFLGLGNFRISVAARLNTDKREIREVAFDPKSRVERSVRVVKETLNSADKKSKKAVTVQQNVPEQPDNAGGDASSQKRNDRREELTNFEVGSRTTSTSSSGYGIDRLTIAVVLNRDRLKKVLEQDGSQGALEGLLQQVEGLVASAAGVDKQRGDTVTITAVNFLADGAVLPPVPERPLLDQLLDHTGSLVNAAAVLAVAFLIVWFGIRPMTATLSKPQAALAQAEAPPGLTSSGDGLAAAALPGGRDERGTEVSSNVPDTGAATSLLAPALESRGDGAVADSLTRLHALVSDEEKAAAVLRRWLKEEPT
jgi:flagellar M-ring protein FliF